MREVSPVKALAITLAAGGAPWAGAVPLSAMPAARLAAAASDLALSKTCAGSAVGIPAGGGPITIAYAPGWLGYGPAWYAGGYRAGLYGRWW